MSSISYLIYSFDYSRDFLRWALTPPEYLKDWHVGVRNKKNGKLMGFITGVPAEISVNGTLIKTAEINFLCVHKSLRSKRLAPVLIKEITRRVNLTDKWQAIYTAGVVLPRPVAKARYWHRSLNPKKLIEVSCFFIIRIIRFLIASRVFLIQLDQVQSSSAPHDNVYDYQVVQAARSSHCSLAPFYPT